MEVKQINQLMLAMGKCGITELLIEREDFKLQLKRGEKPTSSSLDSLAETFEENPLKVDFTRHHATSVVHAESKLASSKAIDEKEDMMSVYVTAPMVGTLYQAPSPNDPIFVKVGDKVEKNTVVCIIEAMKVMNEVKAGVTGVVAEILVENGHPVEFGTKLLRIIPS